METTNSFKAELCDVASIQQFPVYIQNQQLPSEGIILLFLLFCNSNKGYRKS